ncbi:MAG: IPTL-CTERM sorting domain-containing protein, partial [Planctomycetes bacterium]|nr:IPTL-CTERM sorting domain-containing protein [Planctomycetota bacterium]
ICLLPFQDFCCDVEWDLECVAAAEFVCEAAECGDGTLNTTTGEECDDGFTDGCGTCNADCTGPGAGYTCGDGQVCPEFEECDDGSNNSDTEPDACRTDCTAAKCGDGVRDSDEECDDGVGNSDTEQGACRTNCTAAGCGDGVVDSGEECDDGNTESGDGCDENCQVRGACCVTLSGLCMDRVSPDDCQGTHASFHLGVDCNALDPLCAPAFGACCRDDLDQPGGVRSCTRVTLAECGCPSCEWFKLRSCEEVIADELCAPDFFPIPTTSEWGLVILTLLLVTGGKVCFGRRSSTSLG